VNIAARGSNGTPAIPTSRYSIHDNLVDSIAKLGGDGIAMQSLQDVVDIQWRHNTFLNGLQGSGSNSCISFDGAPGVRSVWDSNICGHGDYGVKGANASDGVTSLNAFAPGAMFTNNAIVLGAGQQCGTYPATTSCTSTLPASGTSGRGADLAKVTAATAGVVLPGAMAIARSIARPAQLKYQRPAPRAACQSAATRPLDAAKCDVPLRVQ
jgi:hypothetical protein